MLLRRRAGVVTGVSKSIQEVCDFHERQLAFQDQSPGKPTGLNTLVLTRQKQALNQFKIRVGPSTLPVVAHEWGSTGREWQLPNILDLSCRHETPAPKHLGRNSACRLPLDCENLRAECFICGVVLPKP